MRNQTSLARKDSRKKKVRKKKRLFPFTQAEKEKSSQEDGLKKDIQEANMLLPKRTLFRQPAPKSLRLPLMLAESEDIGLEHCVGATYPG